MCVRLQRIYDCIAFLNVVRLTVVGARVGDGAQTLLCNTLGINIARKVEGMKSIRALTVGDGCESENRLCHIQTVVC